MLGIAPSGHRTVDVAPIKRMPRPAQTNKTSITAMPIVEFHLDVPNATPRSAFDYLSNWPQTLTEWDPSIKEAKQTSNGTARGRTTKGQDTDRKHHMMFARRRILLFSVSLQQRCPHRFALLVLRASRISLN